MDWQVIEGDCLEVMHTIPSGSVDMILCDLPYGTTQATWDSVIPLGPLWAHYKRIIRQGGAIVLFGSQPFTSLLVTSNLAWFRYSWVWSKGRVTGFLDANCRPLKEHEDVVMFYDIQPTYNPQMTQGDKHKRGARAARLRVNETYGTFRDMLRHSDEYYPRSVLEFNAVPVPVHPNEKPVPLLEYLVRTYTNAGDLVLDNTCGSGSTGEACIRTDRRFIGIESKPEYVAIARTRLARVAAEPRQAELWTA